METRPRERKRALPNAAFRALEVLSRHGPLGLLTAAKIADLATPRRSSSPTRRRGVLHCTQARQRSRRRIHPSSEASSPHWLRRKYPAQPRRTGFRSLITRAMETPRERPVSSRTRLLNRSSAFGATQRRRSLSLRSVKPRKERSQGCATALFAALTWSFSRVSRKRVMLAITRRPAFSLRT